MSEETSFEDFLKVDLRIGTIIEVHEFPKARKPAYQLVIDFGTIGIKIICAKFSIHKTSNNINWLLVG